MYKDFYHLTAEPFNAHPATDTFFISSTHKEAWYYLLFGIDTQEPFIVLTGEYGMGKTLLCLQLLKMSKEKGMFRVEYIPTTNEGYGGILRRMATNMEISPLPESEEILQDMVYDRLRAEEGRCRFYLIIDDAHELEPSTLTKLKYLSTFSYNEFFPLVMIFVAHPSFLQELKTPALSSLNQRMKRRYHLSPFSFNDTKNYIYYRLLKSGATGVPSFSDQAIQKIFQYSGGIPRLINNLCDTCLLIGASRRMISISPEVIEEAKKLVEGSLAHGADKALKTGESSHQTVHTGSHAHPSPRAEAAPRADLASNRMFIDDDEQAVVLPEKTSYSKKLKKVALIVFMAILFISLAVLVSEFLPKQRITLPFFSSGTEMEVKQAPSRPAEAGLIVPEVRDDQAAGKTGTTDPVGHGGPLTERGSATGPVPGDEPSARPPEPASVPPAPARTKSMPSLPAMYR
ncbi:MAG: AAA family ATPase [Thermodesulfobacteriota bacterium]